jgi:hypothetical protein
MANLTTVHHININSSDVISVNCPSCKTNQMEQDKEYLSYWTCGNGHKFYVSLYQSSVKTLNLRLIPQFEVSK